MKQNKLSRRFKRIGILVPYTNSNLEIDMALLCPSGVSMHYTRIGGYDSERIPDESEMASLGSSDLSAPLSLLIGVNPDIILYGCTSATLTHGRQFDEKLAFQIKENFGIPLITAASALVDAITSLGVKKIAFTSPYVKTINDQAMTFLNQCGIETVSSFAIEKRLDNVEQGALSTDEIVELAIKADCREAQAIVLSCTDMRSVEVVNYLEEKLAKPVITSNQALLYCACLKLGVKTDEINCGKLFSR